VYDTCRIQKCIHNFGWELERKRSCWRQGALSLCLRIGLLFNILIVILSLRSLVVTSRTILPGVRVGAVCGLVDCHLPRVLIITPDMELAPLVS
jgi:hypothetical protein